MELPDSELKGRPLVQSSAKRKEKKGNVFFPVSDPVGPHDLLPGVRLLHVSAVPSVQACEGIFTQIGKRLVIGEGICDSPVEEEGGVDASISS